MKNFGFWINNFLKKFLHKKIHNLSIHVFLLFTVFFGLQAIEPDLDPKNYATGALPLTEEKIEEIQNNWPQVLGVRPNKYGAARIQEHMQEQGIALVGIEATSDQDEFITNKNTDFNKLSAYQSLGAAALPTKVDNSKLACFPPIGNQGRQGSCVGWASGYYHATHEYGLLNGIENKTSGSAGIRSPKAIYNMINFGADGGSYPTDAYALLKANGAIAWNDFPYDGTNYREWDLNPQHWTSALSYRMSQPQFITINGPNDIDVVKQILTNGHLVTFITYANSWQFSKVLADPSQSSNPYAGQRAISWMNGTSGGHHITIVGYDDSVWIDVNGNGKVDAGEKGAFLIANSWGTSWANSGYVWISYDAFFKTSMVANGPSTNRRQIAQMLFSIVPHKPNYTPKAIAKFSLSQTIRKELKLSLGASSTTATTPTTKFISGALTQDGGAYAFNGQAPSLQTATFVLDATDLLPATNIAQKYYLIVEDTTSGNKTTLNSYSIVDLINNKEVSLAGIPLTCDKSIIQPDIVFKQSNENPDPIKPKINITSPANLSTVSGSVSVTANINENVKVARVEFHVDSKLAGIDLTAPFLLSLDTTKFSNGQHTITAIVYDDAGKSANDSIIVTVKNSESTDFPAYLSYQQKKESGWTTGAQYSCTLKNTGTKPISDLKIKFLVPASNIHLWNVAVNSSDSQSVIIGLPAWKQSLAPGETLSFGFVIYPDVEPKVSFVSATQG